MFVIFLVVCVCARIVIERKDETEGKMKKALPIILLIVMAVCLTSCDPETLGSFMGKMGQNFYGLKANMKDVNKATEKIDNSVTDNGDGTVSIDLDVAAKVIDDIGKIKASEGKTEEFQKQLAEPVSEDNGAAVQVALQSEIQNVIDDVLPNPATIEDPKAKDIVEKVSAALEEAKAGISENPTRAELVTVAVISNMANLAQEIAANPAMLDNVEDQVRVVDAGLSSLDTLKMVSEYAGLSLVDGIDFSALLEDLGKGAEISRADEDDAIKYVAMAADNVRTLIAMLTKDGVVNDIKYSSVLSQAKATRHSFELMAVPYIKGDRTNLADLDQILSNKNIKKGLSTDDFVLYFESLILTELDKDDLKAFVNTHYAKLIDLEHYAEDEQMASDLEDLFDDAKDIIKHKDDGKYTAWNSMGTLAVLLVKTNLKDTIFKIADVESFSAFIDEL